MAGLPRPDIPPGSQRDLIDALHALHHTAGWPSLRRLAGEVGVSPTTVSAVFSAPRLPSWGLLSLLVEALGGDVEAFHRLWLDAGTPDDAYSPQPSGIAGRRDEVAAVRRHVGSGSGLLLVTGEAGIGKTKLVDTARADGEAFVARGAGLPLSVAVPFLPISHALQQVHEADEQWLGGALDACPAYARGALAPLLPEVADVDEPLSSPDGSSRARLFKAVATVLGSLAEHRRLVLLVEDLHWADADTLDLLEHLLVTGEGVPVLGTFRIEDPAVPDAVMAWSVRVRRLANVETLELGPLNRAETAEQIDLLRGPRFEAVGDALVDRVYERSRGQPLFTEQLAAQPDGPMPRLLDDVLGQRVEATTPDERRVVTVLAVADRGLPVERLQAATGLASVELTPCLHALADRRLLAGDSSGGLVTLRHPLLAETVRRHLVPGEAAEVHRALAAALADGGDPAEVAAHWQGAGDVGEELGWRIRAARAAHTRIAASEEARQWRRALEVWARGVLTEREGLRRIDAELALMDALEASGDTQQAWERVVPMLDHVDGLPAMVAAEVLVRAATYADLTVGVLPALDYAERAVALYGDAPWNPSVIRALVEYACGLSYAGRLGEALEVFRRVVTACRALGDAIELRNALVIYAGNLSHLEWSDEIRALLDEAHRIVLPRPDPAGDVRFSLIETDIVLRFGGGTEALLAAGRLGFAAAEEWHLRLFRVLDLRANVASGLLRAGRVAEAAQLVDSYAQDSDHVDAQWLFVVRVALDVARGRLEEARAHLAALKLASPPVEDPELTSLVVPCELWSGRPDLAFARLRRTLESERGASDRVFAGECQVLLVRAASDLVDAGGQERAAVRRQVHDLLAGEDPTDMVCEAQHAYRAARAAELSRLAADPRPDLWVAAARDWDAIGRPFEAGYACWRGAQAARATGQGTEANGLLRRAAKLAKGHVPLTDAIRATVDAAGPARGRAG